MPYLGAPALAGAGGREAVEHGREMSLGNRDFNLFGKGADLVPIVGSKRDVKEAKPVRDEPRDGQVGDRPLRALETLAWREEGGESGATLQDGNH